MMSKKVQTLELKSHNNYTYIEKLRKKEHTKFFERFLKCIPQQLSVLDSQRMTIAFFSISGLDVLNCMNSYSPEQIQATIDWVYSLQVYDDLDEWSGFQGTSCFNYLDKRTHYKCGALAHTYFALSILLTLGDDFSRIHRKSILKSIRKLQQSDGNFSASLIGSESDMRFVYCAACICYMLDDWSGMDVEKTVDYIRKCVSYDFAIGQCPGTESHGGSTFCAIATLALLNRLDALTETQRNGIIRWLVNRQLCGFNGRPNKIDDTCYSFWVVASLKILNAFRFINFDLNRKYIMSTQHSITGGFSKQIDNSPDPLHTYFGICGLSLMGEPGLKELEPTLAISMEAADRLKPIHQRYRNES